jgi:hypothetical protein
MIYLRFDCFFALKQTSVNEPGYTRNGDLVLCIQASLAKPGLQSRNIYKVVAMRATCKHAAIALLGKAALTLATLVAIIIPTTIASLRYYLFWVKGVDYLYEAHDSGEFSV